MDFDHAYRRHKVYAYRNQQRKQKDHEVTHVDSAITAPYNSFTGVTLQKGAALSAEIENYRRRVLTLLNFLDSIAPHWWDQLHPFNNAMVKRPSKSAELIIKLQARLKERLARLTPRMVIPAAAAVVTIEERDVVPVLPPNLLHASPKQRASWRTNVGKLENMQEALRLAYSIARRLGEVERSKQQMILYAVEWINSDGRDFALRAQRLALLTKNIKFCLIEKYKGVQALITHYYRRRSSRDDKEEENSFQAKVETDSKYRLTHAFCEVTAASLSTTSMEILRIIANADLSLATDPAFTTDFIDNYAPNAFSQTPYTLSSVNSDGVSQDGNLSAEMDKDLTPASFIKLEKEAIVKRLSPRDASVKKRPFGLQHRFENTPSEGQKRDADKEMGKNADDEEKSVGLPEINSYINRQPDSETRRKRDTVKFITELVEMEKSKSEEEPVVTKKSAVPMGNQKLPSSLRQSSSSTAVTSALLFRASSSFEDDSQGNSTLRTESGSQNLAQKSSEVKKECSRKLNQKAGFGDKLHTKES